MALEDVEQLFLTTKRELEDIEDILQEELEELLDEGSREEALEQVDDLDSEEFRDLARAALDEL